MKSRAKPWKCLYRVVITAADLHTSRSECESTQDVTYISSGDRCLRHTLRGVPARLVDVALPVAVDHRPLVLEIGEKAGRFDGAVRHRLTARYWKWQTKERGSMDHTGPIPTGTLFLRRGSTTDSADVAGCSAACAAGDLELQAPMEDALEEAGETLITAVVWAGGSWMQSWPCLRSDLREYDLPAIVIWHWRRYYSIIDYADARALADSFEVAHPGIRNLTLAEANRLASRNLYALARVQGWHKLTLRERARWGFGSDAGQWQRSEVVDRRRAELGYPPSGTG